MAQLDHSSQGYWIEMVNKHLQETEIDIPMEQIKAMSIEKFHKIVQIGIRRAAFKYLSMEEAKLSKIMVVPHSELKLQKYFQPLAMMDVQDAKLLFQLRSRMLDVKKNFPKKYRDLCCPICNSDIKYSIIFSDNTDE